MARNSFKDNRLTVQKKFIEELLFLPLTKDDIPYIITEKGISEGEGKLRKVSLHLPATDDSIRPMSYVLDVELSNKLFSGSENQKRVERVFFVMSDTTLYIIMVEMKTLIKPITIHGIKQKIQDTISKLFLFLPYYLLDTIEFDEYKIEYHCLVIYNNDSVTNEVKRDPTLLSDDLFRILQGKQQSFNVREKVFGKECKVQTVFKQNNTNNNEEFDINIEDFFENDHNFLNAVYSDKTLP